jgi:hypothetical protein
MTGKTVAQGLVAAALALAAAGPASAQAKLELTPFFTSFYALAKVSEGSGFYEKHVPAAGFGGRLTYWISPTIGIEASGSYNKSGTQVVVDDTLGVGGASFAGNITTFSGRVLYRPARSNLYLFAGAGSVKRGGDTWDLFGYTELNDIGGLGGFGVRASITPKLALLVSAELMVYSLDPDGPDGTDYESKSQTDVYVSIGIPIALMK